MRKIPDIENGKGTVKVSAMVDQTMLYSYPTLPDKEPVDFDSQGDLIHGPNFKLLMHYPYTRNVRTGAQMTNSHHCPERHGALVNGRWVRCGEAFGLKSDGCGAHTSLAGYNKIHQWFYLQYQQKKKEIVWKWLKIKYEEGVKNQRKARAATRGNKAVVFGATALTNNIAVAETIGNAQQTSNRASTVPVEFEGKVRFALAAAVPVAVGNEHRSINAAFDQPDIHNRPGAAEKLTELIFGNKSKKGGRAKGWGGTRKMREQAAAEAATAKIVTEKRSVTVEIGDDSTRFGHWQQPKGVADDINRQDLQNVAENLESVAVNVAPLPIPQSVQPAVKRPKGRSAKFGVVSNKEKKKTVGCDEEVQMNLIA